MGNDLQKQYNLKGKPLKLPGSYSFLRFFNHPSKEQSLIIIKSPHKATIIQSNMILPIYQINQISLSPTSNDTIARCPKCVPLGLVRPKSETQMKIIIYKILKIQAEIGRCFLSNGRLLVWCEEKRGLTSIAPQQLQHHNHKSTQKSKVFVAGITLVNFLYCVYQNDKQIIRQKEKKQKKDKKKPSSKSLIMSIKDSQKQVKANGGKQPNTSRQVLPSQIKLFFLPSSQKQYISFVSCLGQKLNSSSFFSHISQGLRQLILNMLSLQPTNRVDIDTILGIPYFQQSQQLRLYFMLTEDLDMIQQKERTLFMKALELIIRKGTVFQEQILQQYIVPVLSSIATTKRTNKQSLPLISQALSILLQLLKPPIDIIFISLKQVATNDKDIILLAMEKKDKLFCLFDNDRFDGIISKLLFCCYEIQQLLNTAVVSTPFIMASIKEPKYKKQIQFKLINKVLMLDFDKNSQKIVINGLKCLIVLLKQNLISSPMRITQLNFNPLIISLQANIHLLYIYGLILPLIPSKCLISILIPKLDVYLSCVQISDELFMTANSLLKKIMQRLFQQRKLINQEQVDLQYSEEYFMLKDQHQTNDLHDQSNAIRIFIQKNQIKTLQWIANDIL